MKKLDKKYVSGIDLFLTDFDQQNAPTESQAAEIMKYKVLHQKRNDATLKPSSKKSNGRFWEW